MKSGMESELKDFWIKRLVFAILNAIQCHSWSSPGEEADDSIEKWRRHRQSERQAPITQGDTKELGQSNFHIPSALIGCIHSSLSMHKCISLHLSLAQKFLRSGAKSDRMLTQKQLIPLYCCKIEKIQQTKQSKKNEKPDPAAKDQAQALHRFVAFGRQTHPQTLGRAAGCEVHTVRHGARNGVHHVAHLRSVGLCSGRSLGVQPAGSFLFAKKKV